MQYNWTINVKNDWRLKEALNKLQYYIDKDSDKSLLIFDNMDELNEYKKNLMNEYLSGELKANELDNTILMTYGDLVYKDGLVGRRFKSYMFV